MTEKRISIEQSEYLIFTKIEENYHLFGSVGNKFHYLSADEKLIYSLEEYELAMKNGIQGKELVPYTDYLKRSRFK